MKRDPSRPKASDIDDGFVLRCVKDYCYTGAPHPLERLSTFPLKVIQAKFQKLRQRGLLDQKDGLTEAGRRFLTEREARAS